MVIISRLQVGQKITIAPGCGNPNSEEHRDDVILEVAGGSALTVEGVRLACYDGGGVTLREGVVEDPQPSAAAREIQARFA
jgi:hypothetical protein